MDSTRIQGLLLISTVEIFIVRAFSENTRSENCFSLNKTVRDPPISHGCTNVPQQHGKGAGVTGLRANEGYLQLEKLYASIPFPLRAIFHL